jgi:hypothetical protein
MTEGAGTAAAASMAQSARHERSRTRFVAAGGVLGALAASSCCILPLVLFSLGISGAWIGNLTALAPYKPYFAAATGCSDTAITLFIRSPIGPARTGHARVPCRIGSPS